VVTVTSFAPIGGIPRWRTVYDLLTAVEVAGVLTFEHAGSVLGLDPSTDRPVIAAACRRAGREYLTTHNRAIEPVPNVGYRVVAAKDHAPLARSHQTRSVRAVQRANRLATHVNIEEIDDPVARHAIGLIALVTGQQLDFARRTEAALRRTARDVASLSDRADRTEDETARIHARLARLEAQLTVTEGTA
jgi:hypothetical protein